MGRTPSVPWSRLKPVEMDPLEAIGLPSKGDNRYVTYFMSCFLFLDLRGWMLLYFRTTDLEDPSTDQGPNYTDCSISRRKSDTTPRSSSAT